MSYEVLARKWRPRSFDEVAGQSHVTTALRNAVRSGRVPHAVLLCGPRGVGKTSIARILASCLNCEKGPTDQPCGECIPCGEIAAGRSTDVREIDAASRTSVDDVRELIESIRYAAAPGKHRIFVVDEVHMLSTAAFNALLKTLEEPPPSSLFVFATTNPEKIPFTVISRCQRYDLRRLPAREVVARLQEVARAEKISVSDGSLLAIAREGDGSLRDSLTLLDQILAHGSGEVKDDTVAAVLDLIDRRLLLAIARGCVAGDPAAALEACGHAATAAIDAKRLGGTLLGLFRDLVVLRVAPKAPDLVEGSDAEIEELRGIAETAEPARLRRMFRALLKEQEDLSWSPEPFSVLEMAVVRLATMPSGEEVEALLTRIAALERRLGGEDPTPTGGGPAGGEPKQRKRKLERDSSAPQRRSSEPTARRRTTTSGHQGTEAGTKPSPGAQGEAELGVVYDRLRAFAQEENRGLFAGLEGGELLERGAGRLRIHVPSGLAARRLLNRTADLEAICTRFFGEPTRVEIETTPEDSPQPEETDPETARRRRQQALDHPGVNAALEVLGGEILEIRPHGEKP